jgi:cytochrome c oxidase subunit 2
VVSSIGRAVGRCASVALLVGCGGDQNMLSPGGPGARSLASLGSIALWVFSLTTIVTWALLAFVALRRRGSLDSHAPHDVGGGERWILVGGFLIPAFTFGSLFVLTLIRMDEFPLHDDENHAAEIRVIGHQWWWEVRYLGESPDMELTTANELHLPIGQPITVELSSRDVIHSFWVPKLHGKVDLVPGQTNHLRLQADQLGTYEGECAEFCGAQHAHMRLRVVAQTRQDYAKWVAAQAEAAPTPADPTAQRGQSLFETRACALCHTVRGSRARGTVGPDLTHLASRDRIAANSLPNNQAHLAAWAVRAQSLKPAVQMPNLNEFDGPELNALTHFLQGLK